MASKTVTASPRFAEGVTLSVWPAVSVTGDGATGAAVTSATVTNGQAAFSGLTAGARYAAGATSSGPFISFSADPDPVSGSSGSSAPAAIFRDPLVRAEQLSAVMATPPTTTLTLGAGPVIVGATLRAWNTAPFRVLGAALTLAGAGFPDNLFGTSNSITSPPSSRMPYAVEFDFDGDSFEIYTKANTSAAYRIWVDGAPATASSVALGGTAGSRYTVKVDLGSVKPRRIRLEFASPFFFGGIYCMPAYSVSAPSRRAGKRILFLGDSFTEPTVLGGGNSGSCDGLATIAGRLLGFNDVWASGSGGTGYLNPGAGGRVKFSGRQAADVIARAPDVVVYCGGRNDTDTNTWTIPNLTTEVAALFDAALAGLPNAKFFVLAPFASSTAHNTSSSAGSNFLGVRDVLQAAATARGWSFIDGLAAGWINDSNAAAYIGSDTTHPTIAGHQYLGWRIAAAMTSDPKLS